MTCGTVAEEDPQLVAEQQFNEERGGRITAQGQTVAHDQTHQRTYGQPAGSGTKNQQQDITLAQARTVARTTMKEYLAPLNIPESEVEAGLAIWTLAYTQKFVQGRGLRNVATVCFFLALRRRTEQVQGKPRPKYPVMLIDFAEIANVDVFTLGRMYTDLVRVLYLDTSTQYMGPEILDLLAHGPEVLVDRFVDALEFPPQSVRRIKDDAVRIVKRMNRDWMNIGRRPAGVTGAAVILAARMNNHRRTTREVVLTAKVTEITLNKRLEEFSDVKSSQLSVNDFRNTQLLNAIESADPPAYARAHNPPKEKKRKRGRPRKNQAPETAAEIEGDDADTVTQNGAPPAKRARVDAEGFVIPDLPQRSTVDEIGSKRGPGRPPGARNWRAPPITPAEQALEDEITGDINRTLEENPDLDPTPITEEIGENTKVPHSIRAKIAEVRAASHTKGNTNTICLDPEIGKDEFEDDEEVAICLLTEEERRMKEIVWVNANADWLRQQHAKQIRQYLKDEELRLKGIDPATIEKGKGKEKRRKDGRVRAGPAGDVRYLQNAEGKRKRQGSGAEGEGEAEGETEGGRYPEAQGDEREGSRTRSPSESPFPTIHSAAGSMRMFYEQRGNAFASRRINTAALEEVYTYRPERSSSPSGDSSTPTHQRSGGSPSQRRSGGSASVEHSQMVFGAIGSKESGLMRSKSSWSAERREKQKREMKSRQGTSGTGGAGPSAREGSGSASASVSTSPEVEGDERERSGSASVASEEGTPTPTATVTTAPGPQAQARTQPTGASQSISQPTSQQHTPTSTHLDDGSVEEVVGSNPASVSRSHSDTPGPGDGLITLREDAEIEDEDEEDEDEEDGEEDDGEDDDSEGAVEPDLDDVFAGRLGGSRRR